MKHEFKKINKNTYRSLFFLLFLSLTLTVLITMIKGGGMDFRSRAAGFNFERPSCLFGKTALIANIDYPPNANLILIPRGEVMALDSDFTIELLVKPLPAGNFNNPSLIHAGNGFNLFIDSGQSGTENKIAVMLGNGSTLTPLIGPEISTNSWHHVAVTYTRNTPKKGTLGLHVDGKTKVLNNVPFLDNLSIFELGGSYFNGFIDEIRVSKKVIYSQTNSKYQVPTQPFNSNKQTLLLLHLDENTQDSSGNNNHGQTNGQVTFSNSNYRCVLPFSKTTPSPSPVVRKRVFITSTSYNGDLGGLSGADLKCQQSADSVNLGGVWKAWLSDNTTSVADRFNHTNTSYKDLAGTIIANNWVDLTDGTIQNPITVTEINSNIGDHVWTGTRDNGEIMNPGESKCLNWTSSSDFSGAGAVGHSGYSDYRWSWGSSFGCNTAFRLYCFEQ